MTITKLLAGGVSAVAIGASIACGAGTNPGALSQTALASGAPAPASGTPVVVSCEPHQRTLVRPVVVNGATVSQVECISGAAMPVATAASAYAPAALEAGRAARPAQPAQPVRAFDDGLADARVVPVSQPVTVARPVTTQQVVYREPRRQVRSVKKSAIIIGSSAGAGAGVGAAIGGKKGALIGAAIGGGGAALWDQITRRDR
jgi:hypothetical protein